MLGYSLITVKIIALEYKFPPTATRRGSIRLLGVPFLTVWETQMSVELPKKFENIVVNAAEEWLKTRGMTRDQLRSFIEKRVIRDIELSPKLGDDAPDIELELLNNNGARSGETVKLSSYFGKPVGLIFGSYT